MSQFMPKNVHLASAAALGAVTAIGSAGYYLWNRCSKPQVLKLIIFPIKSLAGVEVDALEITPMGVKYGPFLDRAYMMINENNLLISQRTKPKLSLIKLAFSGTTIIFNAPGMEQLVLDITEDLSQNENIDFTLWDQPTAGVLCNPNICKWLSDYLGSEVKLVRFIDDKHPNRLAGVQKTDGVVLDEKLPIRYQDGDPVLLINSTSIDDLNSRITDVTGRVTYRNFRPNIFVKLNEAYEEDEVKLYTIGDVTFENIKLCDRCTFPSVNPDLGIKHSELEPLKTLKTYRLPTKPGLSAPCFGINLAPLQHGTVKLGDSVEVNEKFANN